MQRISFSTGSRTSEQAFAAYHDLYAPVADASRLGDAFSVEVDAYRLGEFILFDRRMSAVSHSRPLRRAVRDGFDHFTVQLVLGGRLDLWTDAQEHVVEEGGLALIDMARPMRTDVAHGNILTLSVPRAAVENATPDAGRLHGATFSAGDTAFVRDLLLSCRRQHQWIEAQDPSRFGRMLGEALGMLFERHTPASRGEAIDAVCRERARRAIDADPSLDPDGLAKALGRSRSALYRAFEADGGVARFIQVRRLARLRAHLADRSEPRSVAQLAFLCGFASDSHCSRAFKSAYDMTPGEYRAHRRQTAARVGERQGAPTVLESWWLNMR